MNYYTDARKMWNKKNREKIRLQQTTYYQKYYLENKEKIQAQNKNNYNKTKQQVIIRVKRYYRENKSKIIAKHHQYGKKRYYSNPQYKIALNLRTRVYNALKSQFTSKSVTTINLLGCSIIDLKAHLESQFQPGMSWDNHGKWHIDHIIPCAIFNLSEFEEQQQCFHYTNLQPLWAKDNLSKGNKY